MLNLQNLDAIKKKLLVCDTSSFRSSGDSFKLFLNELKINNFRGISNLEVSFDHPVTVIAGTNKVGKTSALLLIACSYHDFNRYDSTAYGTVLRRHTWKDVLTFTRYETMTHNYSYELRWRVGTAIRSGEGKRLASSQAWTGLGKSSTDPSRRNAQIKDREVRLIDLERLLPTRNFSISLRRKIETATKTRIGQAIEQAFAYILNIPSSIEIYSIGSHINKIAYLISYSSEPYSSYNASSGEESLLNILVEIISTPADALIIIDEIEAGLHPDAQRKLANIIQYLSWTDKKQFILTTHSPSFLAALPQKSRRFIDKNSAGSYETIKAISVNAAFSKMDSKAYPLVTLYCEDDEAEFIIKNVLVSINVTHKNFDRLINIIKSGPADQVRNDYVRHKRNFEQMQFKIGYAAIFDGDYRDNSNYSNYHENPSEYSFFLYPYVAPEKFLVKAYLGARPNPQLQASLRDTDHHSLFQEMVSLGLATDVSQARQLCWDAFKSTPEYVTLETNLQQFLIRATTDFSLKSD